MSDIFISYAREDHNTVKELAHALEEHGFDIWWDDRIDPGRAFDEIILQEITKARCIIVLWSEASIKSQWVKEEAIEGLERQVLIPVLIEDVDIPIGFRLIQAVHLISWQGNRKSPMFIKLLKTISKMLEEDLEGILFKEEMSNSQIKNDLNVSWSAHDFGLAVFIFLLTLIACGFWAYFFWEYIGINRFPGSKIVSILGLGVIFFTGVFTIAQIPKASENDGKGQKRLLIYSHSSTFLSISLLSYTAWLSCKVFFYYGSLASYIGSILVLGVILLVGIFLFKKLLPSSENYEKYIIFLTYIAIFFWIEFSYSFLNSHLAYILGFGVIFNLGPPFLKKVFTSSKNTEQNNKRNGNEVGK